MSKCLERYGATRIANPNGVCKISHLDLTILVLVRSAFKNVNHCCEAGGDPTAMIAPQIAAQKSLKGRRVQPVSSQETNKK
jgi:hypothetical protein